MTTTEEGPAEEDIGSSTAKVLERGREILADSKELLEELTDALPDSTPESTR